MAALLLMVASGFAGLGYQLIWTQQLSVWLGHEAAAMLAVVAAFFGGFALGGWALGSRIERSSNPLRWYIACELLIALWSLMLSQGLARISGWWLSAIGADPAPARQWSVVLGSTFLLLLPATAAMGATLPAMERLSRQPRGRSIAALYACNTLGAVLGVLATAFWLVPALGLAWSAALCVALNLVCCAVALLQFPRVTTPVPLPAQQRGPSTRGILLRLAATGLLGIGYEVAVVRALSQVTENTVYTFALLLAVYLVGTAVGAAAYRRLIEARADREDWGDRLMVLLASACLLGASSLWRALDLNEWATQALGASARAAVAAEGLLAMLAFGPPTLLMGAVFSHLCRSASSAGVPFGHALGANTLAGALAPALCGVLAIPALGLKATLLTIAAGYLALTAQRVWLTPSFLLPAAGALGLALVTPPLSFVQVPVGGRLVSYREGITAAVSVVEDAGGVARLHINNRQQEGSNATRHVDARQAWLPLLLHPGPRRALFLGLGTGVTAASAAEDSTLSVDVVELLPEVVEASQYFRDDTAAGAARLQYRVADARRYVRASEERYDVIVSDNFHPARSGSASLYTVEHFRAVAARLTEDALFCQWLPLHQLDLQTLRSIVRSFVAVYPVSFALLASNSLETPVLGLVARSRGRRFQLVELRERLKQLALPERVTSLGFEDEYAVLGSFLAAPQALEQFAGDAPANTDDRPLVAYRAPWLTYAADSRPRDRLLQLLHGTSIEPHALLAGNDPVLARRLAAYWFARNRYLELGRDVRPSLRVEDMLAQVRSPLLSVLRISPDFRPAYDPLVAMASALSRSDAAAAGALLAELASIQPARSEAPQLLSLLSSSAADNRSRP